MDFQIKNKTAIVCASSQGLGKAAAKELASEGVNLVISSRNEENLLIVKREIENLNTLIPENTTQPYNMKDVIKNIVDNGEFYPIHENYAKNILTGLSRFDGATVGIVANQPTELAGVLDIKASEKAARFIRFCDAF